MNATATPRLRWTDIEDQPRWNVDHTDVVPRANLILETPIDDEDDVWDEVDCMTVTFSPGGSGDKDDAYTAAPFERAEAAMRARHNLPASTVVDTPAS